MDVLSNPRYRGLRPWTKETAPTHTPGRNKGLALRIREQTLEGKELVDFALRILRDNVQQRIGDKMVDVPVAMSYRLEALQWLTDRGFGKAVQAVDVQQSLRIQLTWDDEQGSDEGSEPPVVIEHQAPENE